MLKGLYGNLLNYESLPADGHVDQPLSIWIAVTGRQHRRGLADRARSRAAGTARLQRPGRDRRQGDERFQDVDLSYMLPDSTWTPTGGGPICVLGRRAGPDPRADADRLGHSGAAGAVFPMCPYGSVFVRAETGRYGESIDCLEGLIDFADTVDRVLEPRPSEPDAPDPDAGRRR